MTSQTEQQNITTHLLPNISRQPDNESCSVEEEMYNTMNSY